MMKFSAQATFRWALAGVLVLLSCHWAIAQESTPWSQNTSPLPPPTGFVNDFAGVIDENTRQQLEKTLTDLRDSTSPSVEIAVVTVDTTGGRDIFDYSLAVARGWGIGSKQDDNPSALLLVAIKDRKYFTQISRDLEDELPDGIAGSLQRQFLVPEFRKGNYGKGISDTINAYIGVIRKTNVPTVNTGNRGNTERTPPSPSPVAAGGSGLFCCAVIGLVLLVLFLSRNKGGPTDDDRDRWGGGPGGGGDSGLGSALPWIIGSIIASSASGRSSSGGWGGSSGGWGGSSGGWGGFGGGGDFGGGGAGGGW